MLNSKIEDEECLYRGVIVHPNYWDIEKDRPSSAIFKDSKGVSVDRDGGREEQVAIKALITKLSLKAVVKIHALKCRELNAFLIPKAEPDNIYHAEIHDSENKIEIGGSKAKKLRDSSIVVYKI